MTAPSLQDRLRDRIAQAIESVAHDPGGRPCELCVDTADAVLAVLANADPTDDLWGRVWRRLGNAHPRTEEAHTVDVGHVHVHVLAEPGGPCAPGCPHPDHRTEEA